MRGDAAFSLLQASSARALANGDTRTAAITLAAAATIGGRCPGLFSEPLSHEELVPLVDMAQGLHHPDDLEVQTYIALAAAWDSARALAVPDRERAKDALVFAATPGRPGPHEQRPRCQLRGGGRGQQLQGRFAVHRSTTGATGCAPRHEPRVGGEVADIFHMATESALAAGELHLAMASARMSYYDSSSEGLPHFAANHLVIPLALQGEFDEAVRQAQIMREGWERAGSPAAGWMAPSFFATALVHGLRGDSDAYTEFWDLAMTIRMQRMVNSFSLFVEPRVALHLGALDRAVAVAAVDEQEMCGHFGPYARAISVEIAVISGAADAEERWAAAHFLSRENDFVAAILLRAAGRLIATRLY